MDRVLTLAAIILVAWAGASLLRRYFSSHRIPSTFDRSDVQAGAGPLLVEFTSPYCYECKEVLPLLKAAAHVYGTGLAVIDAKDRPDLAAKYAIRSTPTILVVDHRGSVRQGWKNLPTEQELEDALKLAASF